jgi:MSHA type pilus biogenesis protein MshL
MVTLQKTLPLLLTGLLLGGCATTGTEPEPLKVPSGALDYKPSPPRPAELDVQSRMTQFTTPAPVADIKLYSFRSTGQPVNLALSQLATAYGLNVVVDQDVEGQVTVDLKQLPLEKVLEAILEPLGLAWAWEDGLLRVSRQETRTFNIDYLRLVRSGNGTSSSSVSLSSGGGGGGGSAGNSSSSVAQNDTINFWNELQEQLEAMLERNEADYIGSERPVETTIQTDRETNITTTLTQPVRESEGRLVMDRLSGTVQVTTSRARMKNVAEFIDRVKSGINRQVYIEAKVVEVQLNDERSLGIDWNELDFGSLKLGTDLIISSPAGGFGALPPTVAGSYIRSFNGTLESIDAALVALEEQGDVNVVSQPRVRTLNNQQAIVRVGTERTFFTTTTTITPVPGSTPIQSVTNTPSTINEGLVLTVTPQISENGEITMDVSPVLTNITGTDVSPDGLSNAPILDIKQTSTLVRMFDGETIVVGGLIQQGVSSTRRAVPLLGDIPGLGTLFSATYDRDVARELVIFLTPRVIY